MKLTEEQHCAVEAAQGKPVEVIDPQTQRTYVLLSSEQYQRVRGLVEGPEAGRAPVLPPEPEPPKNPLIPEKGPMRVKVRDLPTPPELAAEAKRYCKQLGTCWRKDVLEAEDELKVQYYFGGQAVSYLRTKEGPVIVAAGYRDSDAYDQLLAFLPAEERRRVILDFPSKWNDTTSCV